MKKMGKVGTGKGGEETEKGRGWGKEFGGEWENGMVKTEGMEG